MIQPFTLARLRPALGLAAALFLWTGCDSDSATFETPDFDRDEETVVAAYDRDGTQVGEVSVSRLFAEPTQAELDAALASVSGRDTGVYDFQTIGDPVPTGVGMLYVVSHTVRAAPTGETFPTHYGAIHVPNGADNLPVLVYSHGGDDGVDAGQPFRLLGFIDPETDQPTTPDPAVLQFASSVVMVIPTFRSEDLSFDDVEILLQNAPGQPSLEDFNLDDSYVSTGNPSPWDYDVDDATALLNATLQEFGGATDEDRIGVLGFSRGAATGLLMSVRDDRVDVVTDFFGPTDFLEPNFQDLAEALLGGPANSAGQAAQQFALQLPGADFILDELLLPLSQAGPNGIAYARARQAILFRSASYYTERMPALQVLHHAQDPVVFASQSELLDQRRQAEPNEGAYDFNIYTNPLPPNVPQDPRSFHSPASFPESLGRTLQFHFANLIGATP